MDFIDALYDYIDEADDSDLQKANRILKKNHHVLDLAIPKKNHYKIAVPSESSRERYSVAIKLVKGYLDVDCSCPAFEQYGGCKHIVAAAIYLRDYFDNDGEDTEYWHDEGVGLSEEDENEADDDEEKDDTLPTNLGRRPEGSFVLQMDGINPTLLMRLAGAINESSLRVLANKTELIENNGKDFHFLIRDSKNINHTVHILFDGVKTFTTTSSFKLVNTLLSVYEAAAFYFVELRYGSRYFHQFKTFEKEKNQALAPYGLTHTDAEAADFKWENDYSGRLVMRSKPAYLVSTSDKNFMDELKKSIESPDTEYASHMRPILPANVMVDYEIGLLFNFASTKHIGFEMEPLQLSSARGKSKISKLKIIPANYGMLHSLTDELYSFVLAFSDAALVEWFQQNGNPNVMRYAQPWQYINQSDKIGLQKHYFKLLKATWPTLVGREHYYAQKVLRFSPSNLVAVKLSEHFVEIAFEVTHTEKFISVLLILKANGEKLIGEIELYGEMIFENENILYLPADQKDLALLQRFKAGKLVFPIANMKEVLLNVIMPLKEKHAVELDGDFNFSITELVPEPRVMLSELNEQFLMVRPQFLYGETLVDYNTSKDIVLEGDDHLAIMKRSKIVEKKLYDFLRTLHPKFASQNNNQHYYLPFIEVMKGNWFFNMLKTVEANGFSVYGLKELKKFKYNINTPKLEIRAGNGTDWFDLSLEAIWGEQQVTLKDLRKAIINRQETILLDDGTLGIIPQEWISQYRTLLKISNETNGTLKVSKLHFGLLDQLDGALANDEIKKEIEAKKKKLAGFSGIKAVAPSTAINANMRPYQLAGFEWMQALDEMGWGGCLADDMGLGKTLQAITFLQFTKEKYPRSTSLVVCPTSLLFNWESELQKFCPSLKYHVYYGLQRTISEEHFEEYDLVLTSYGIMRNDLEDLKKFSWQYVILDESQAIKNPDAQIAQAVMHLKTKNKLILSGTPVQNNTYDLFAQFNFLNPGLLGNREFFREEFANAIDRNQDKAKAEQLRLMVYPFMLRRTKDQVAKDLPAKTETILWCIMDKAQRRLYEEYKNHYRNLLLKKIDEEGIGKAGIYVLEGLLRLRQICDHPALIKDKPNMVNESVKSEELLREIQENTGEHKLLVFSQFTEMLKLIRDDLKRNKIAYCYLDGSTPAEKRKEQVEQFQQDSTIKVFLISLKAGGVGLNLTAADYVYLVDPWWNPAAEQQAIDRTHRIGQTRKIFAYKMICKDTVEEKILKLQEKKKALANDLVSEDAAFTKRLTRDDVAYLFS